VRRQPAARGLAARDLCGRAPRRPESRDRVGPGLARYLHRSPLPGGGHAHGRVERRLGVPRRCLREGESFQPALLGDPLHLPRGADLLRPRPLPGGQRGARSGHRHDPRKRRRLLREGRPESRRGGQDARQLRRRLRGGLARPLSRGGQAGDHLRGHARGDEHQHLVSVNRGALRALRTTVLLRRVRPRRRQLRNARLRRATWVARPPALPDAEQLLGPDECHKDQSVPWCEIRRLLLGVLAADARTRILLHGRGDGACGRWQRGGAHRSERTRAGQLRGDHDARHQDGQAQPEVDSAADHHPRRRGRGRPCPVAPLWHGVCQFEPL
jgi:hypothetical protein